jgi:fatty acid-binding protein DegV
LISSNGKLQVQNTIKGNRKAVAYLLEMLQKHGVEAKDNFFDRPLYLVRTSKNDTYDFLKQELKRRYPKLVIKESIVGPVIGAHVGCGASIIFFEGAPRFKI